MHPSLITQYNYNSLQHTQKSVSSTSITNIRLLSPYSFSKFKLNEPNLPKKCFSSYSLRCFSQLSEVKKAEPKSIIKVKNTHHKVISAMGVKRKDKDKTIVIPQKQVACTINCEFPYRRQISLCNESPICTTQRFLNEHNTIALQLSDATPLQTLTTLKNKLISQWKTPKPRPISLRTRVMRIIEKLKLLQINITDLQLGVVFSSKSFEKKFSKQFIESCKNGDEHLVSEYLSKNKFLVYDFDYTHKTALHWATMRSSYSIMEQLIVFHADVDAKDLMNKTALHYAAQANDLIAIKILLSNHADPFIHCNAGLKPQEMATSFEAKILFKKARKIRVIMKWVPYEYQRNYLITTLREINDTGFA